MTRPRTLAAGLLLALAALLLTPGTALATTAGDVARALLADPVYVDPQATAPVDRARVEAAVRDAGSRSTSRCSRPALPRPTAARTV